MNNKKLEARISRLEKLLSNEKSIKNESADAVAEAVYDASNKVRQVCQSLAVVMQSANEMNLPEVENALSLCEDDFPQRWFERYERILSRK